MDAAEESRVRSSGRQAEAMTDDAAAEARPAESTTSCGDDTRCVICLDSVSEPCTAQPCGHRHFDFLCLVSWLLQQQPSCPLCKAAVATVQYGFADGRWKTFPVPGPATAAPSTTTTASSTPSTPSTSSTSAAQLFRRRRERSSSSYSSSAPSPAAVLERRRRVYRLGLYSLHMGANRHSRYYRELTPRLFAQDPDLVSRARAFIRRELRVLLPGGADTDIASGPAPSAALAARLSSAEFLLEYVVAILKTIDMQGSAGQAEELLREFLGRDATRLFLHELRSWLRSPYRTLESWDRNVQYGPPGPRRPADDEKDDDDDGDDDNVSPPMAKMPRRGDYWRPPPSSRRESDRRRRERYSCSRRSRRDGNVWPEGGRRHNPS